ncbi:hypothetical protein LSUB1_G002959 [Lachnellula subtilissima]|uniref:Uncharacterized protein n=1 Tax=Lachnellula subtilissima TaxID=602034 RepID=A0A8H8S187_9HELO|nr:hypothetical protein LSUB1_G002959 [Lachnellula subtilissima]
MAFFYDSDEEHGMGGLPIILEPDNESNPSPMRRSSYEGAKFHRPNYDGASYKGESDSDYEEEEDEVSQLNSATYEEPSVVPRLNALRYNGSEISESTEPSYDEIRSRTLREHDDTMKEVGVPFDTMKEVHIESPPLPSVPSPAPLVNVPTHPIASMQDAFAESMVEVSGGVTSEPKIKVGSAALRRKLLLDQDIHEETHASRWRQKPGQQYHELWKLMAQISFGIYLLLNGLAKDDDQVMNILQGHVDEVDAFLETTLEDFDLADGDIAERLDLLKMPLENIKIFDAMLEDRNFRVQIVNGNERIEHVITRTARAMNDALKDVTQGLDACKEFTIYLAREQEAAVWRRERPDMQKVFDAMKGNVEGWYKAYVSLQTKGNNLGVALVQLGTIVAEMDKRAGDISRRQARVCSTIFTYLRISLTHLQLSGSLSSSAPSPSPRASKQMRQSMLRSLPPDPTVITPAIKATLPAFGMVDDRERLPGLEPEQRQELDAQSFAPTENESSAPSELAAPEPEFILKPHTYSPAPSPKLPSAVRAPSAPSPVVEKAPEPSPAKPKLSLRKRFSLKRKTSEMTMKAAPIPANDELLSPRQSVRSGEKEHIVNTPPSRGLDSAYCSDVEKKEKKSPYSGWTHPGLPRNPPATNSPRMVNIPARQQSHDNLPHTLTRDFMPSPRSDQQFFRPVQASPNSPLQRPWTAAPANIDHLHSNSSSSNLRFGATPTPSNIGNRRGAPSAMGMSVMTDMTMMTENGKKVKKKRSAFGWLKKQFSLSEEEKAAFEERRRGADQDHYRQQERGQQRHVRGLASGVGKRKSESLDWIERRKIPTPRTHMFDI